MGIKNCESLYCTSVTYRLLYINYTPIFKKCYLLLKRHAPNHRVFEILLFEDFLASVKELDLFVVSDRHPAQTNLIKREYIDSQNW